MPISKKAKVCAHPPASRENESVIDNIQIQREHKKAEAAGTRAPVKPNGLPVKAKKPTSIVRNYYTSH
jgi:hypothetical protein